MTLIVMLAVALTACVSTVNRPELVAAMQENVAKRNSHINILWYEGTKDHFHYVSHVYAMFGGSSFRVSDSQLVIPENEIMPLTTDSAKFKRIASIGEVWSASRKNFDSGLWIPEPEGLILKE